MGKIFKNLFGLNLLPSPILTITSQSNIIITYYFNEGEQHEQADARQRSRCQRSI